MKAAARQEKAEQIEQKIQQYKGLKHIPRIKDRWRQKMIFRGKEVFGKAWRSRKESKEEKKMKDEELKAQINDIIEAEIQNGINDYLETKDSKEDSGVGFLDTESGADQLNVKVYKDEVDKLIKEYKYKIMQDALL